MPQTRGPRALLITTDYPPDLGGLQTYSWRIASDLPGGLLAQVIVGSDHPSHLLPHPGRGIAFSAHRGRSRWRAFAWSLAQIVSLRARRRIDFQLHMQWSTAFASYLLKKIGLPSRYAILIHGAEILDPGRPLLNLVKARLFENADAVIAGSAATAALFRELGLRARRLEIIPYGNPLEGEAAPTAAPRKGAAAPRKGADPRRPKLLCMHRLVARKGTALLIEALSGLRSLPWTLDIVGRGEEEEALRKHVSYLGFAGRIAFHPPADEGDKIRLLAAADLFILPSLPPQGNNHVEGLGLTLLEAQSLGTAVLAARTGGIPEALCEDMTGALFTAGDVEDLRRALSELLKAPENLSRMGEAGPRWVADHFSWKTSLERLAQLIAELAAGP
jgi:phosphatidylinositol alpha-1,6-mannosyltransferase